MKEAQITTRPHTAQEAIVEEIKRSAALVRVSPNFKKLIDEFRSALHEIEGNDLEGHDDDADLISVAARCYMQRIVEQANAKSMSQLPGGAQ